MQAPFEHSALQDMGLSSPKRRSDAHRAAWDKTDRLFRFPRREETMKDAMGTLPQSDDPARARWLEENDVHTEFLDAGIGCCWFAYQDDQEPVAGETEEEALARLAGEKGLELWHKPVTENRTSGHSDSQS
jgi:hypothetical protein